MTDSTMSVGWIRKTNFKMDNVDINDIKEFSQWFEEKKNQVADALSREFERSDYDLTNTLRSLFPSQLPEHFKIVPLPIKR